VVTHLPPHTYCPDCVGALRKFGEDDSEQLERIPATSKLIRHVRPKYACAGCERVEQCVLVYFCRTLVQEIDLSGERSTAVERSPLNSSL
jgi:hypothetical protein